MPQSQLLSLVQDAKRFGFRNRGMIESAPLQVYASALIFSPRESKIRKIFKDDEPSWMALKPAVETEWDACLHILDGHSGKVTSVAFSPDSQLLASGSSDTTIIVWDANSGSFLHVLSGHDKAVNSVVFSPNGQQLTSASYDNTVKIWDIESHACLRTLSGYDCALNSIALSPDGQLLALASEMVGVWDANLKTCLQTFEGHDYSVYPISFSPNGKLLASSSSGIMNWDARTGACLQELANDDDVPSHWIGSSAFSPYGQLLASGSYHHAIRIWDTNSDTCLQICEGHRDRILSVAFSPDSQWLASGSKDKMIKIWDVKSAICIKTFSGHNGEATSVVFSSNSQWLASTSTDETVRIWDVSLSTDPQTLESHDSSIIAITFSPSGHLIASRSENGMVKIWDAKLGTCLRTLKEDDDLVEFPSFSSNSRIYTSVSSESSATLCDAHFRNRLARGSGIHFDEDSRYYPGKFQVGRGRCVLCLWFGQVDMLHYTTGGWVPLPLPTQDSYWKYICVTGRTAAPGKGPQYGSLLRYMDYYFETRDDETRTRIPCDGTWITKEGKRLIWLPPEYRPRVSAVFGDTVAIGCPSGRVLIMRFSPNQG